jgi:hypothetical protein
MQAWLFVIRYRDSRKVAGAALIALEARYAAGCWCGAPRLDRGFATPKLWNEIRHSIAAGLPPAPLPSSDALVAVLLAGKAVDVQLQYLKMIDVSIDAPDQTVSLLDNVLIRETAALEAPSQRVG